MILFLGMIFIHDVVAQVPEAFKYQAVIRGLDGQPLSGQKVSLQVEFVSKTTGIPYFIEQDTATSSQEGIVNIEIGHGEILSGSLDAVPWLDGDILLHTKVQLPGNPDMIDLGSSRVLAVPYALMAARFAGKPKLEIRSELNYPSDSALFEVKNKLGETVFAVYEDGAELLLNEGAKGGRGGFAVGGRRPGKGYQVEDILKITPDSVRIYINDSTLTKGGRGGFAVSGRTPAKGASVNDYFSVSAQQSLDTVKGSPRILWYPRKEAFLAGNVLIQSPDSVGRNSFSTGYQSKSIGNYSQALGYSAISRGNYASSFGYMSVANADNSFAFGQNAHALNQESYAFGRGAEARGFRSFAFGSAGVDNNGKTTGVTTASGDYSFAVGQGSVSSGKGALALGLSDSATGNYSIAMGIGSSARNFFATAIGPNCLASNMGSLALGYVAKATNDYATAIGNTTVSSGYSSTAIGYSTVAKGDYAVALGYSTQANANYSTALGFSNVASGWYSLATGNATRATGGGSFSLGGNTLASGFYSIAAGGGTTASGSQSFAMGSVTTASGSLATALGFYSKARSYASLVIGQFNDTTSSSATSWSASDPVFVIGNGAADYSRSNALTVLKGGQVGLQSVIQPSYALELPNNSAIGIGSARAYAWTTYSDARLKDHLADLHYGLTDLMKLEPRQYVHHRSTDKSAWTNDKGVPTIGLVAQEVYNIIPEAVEAPSENSGELWGINYDKLIPVLIQAIKDQQKTIEELKGQANRIDELERQLAEMKKLYGK